MCGYKKIAVFEEIAIDRLSNNKVTGSQPGFFWGILFFFYTFPLNPICGAMVMQNRSAENAT